MLVVVQSKRHRRTDAKPTVCEKIELLGYRAHQLPGAERTAIGITGNIRAKVRARRAVDEMPEGPGGNRRHQAL